MEPRQQLRFLTTDDRVTIAGAVTGSGPPLVRAGTWMSHLECDLREPDTWSMIEALSQQHTFIRYDPRGCGLSTRQVPAFDFETLLSDFEAVMDAWVPEPAPLLGISCGAAIAIAYAARHPERVTSLVILNGYGRAYLSAATCPPHLIEEAKLLLASARQGWAYEKSPFRQIFIAQMLGADAAEASARDMIDERMRLSMTPDMAEQFLRLNY